MNESLFGMVPESVVRKVSKAYEPTGADQGASVSLPPLPRNIHTLGRRREGELPLVYCVSEANEPAVAPVSLYAMRGGSYQAQGQSPEGANKASNADHCALPIRNK